MASTAKGQGSREPKTRRRRKRTKASLGESFIDRAVCRLNQVPMEHLKSGSGTFIIVGLVPKAGWSPASGIANGSKDNPPPADDAADYSLCNQYSK